MELFRKMTLFNKILICHGIHKYTMVDMNTTTIKIHKETKAEIDQFREYKNESYDDVLKKLIYIVKNIQKKPELSKETIDAIEQARERIKKGNFVTEKEAKRRLGLI